MPGMCKIKKVLRKKNKNAAFVCKPHVISASSADLQKFVSPYLPLHHNTAVRTYAWLLSKQYVQFSNAAGFR